MDPAKPMRSQQQSSEHAMFMDKLAADGFVVLGEAAISMSVARSVPRPHGT